MSELTLLFGFILLWAAVGTALGLLARRKHRRALAWGLVGGFPYLMLFAAVALSLMPFLCPKCKAALTNRQWKERDCPKCGPSAGSELAHPRVRWRWLVVGGIAVGIAVVYTWSTSSVRNSVQGVCDSVAIGDPVTGLEERARAAGLRVGTVPAEVNASGRPRDAYIFVHGSSVFFYVYNCWVYQKDGHVTSKHAAGGAL